MYGYLLVKEIEERSNGYFHFKEGTLYPALHRMEKDRLIAGRWAQSQSGQQRRYYSITDNGRTALNSMLKEWHMFYRAVNSIAQVEAS